MATAALVMAVDVASAQNFEVLAAFGPGYTPSAPESGVILGVDGNYYGTTWGGGADLGGTIYRLTPGGALTVLHEFDRATDGLLPLALMQASDGNFYGTTLRGIYHPDPPVQAAVQGTIYQVTPAGAFTVLYRIADLDLALGYYPDGYSPSGGLLEVDGYLYGVMTKGGQFGIGTIFKVSLAGDFSVVHHFQVNVTAYPLGGLAKGNDGRLYGTSSGGVGAVWSIDSAGNDFTQHAGLDYNTGYEPHGPLALGTDGNLYGAACHGGLDAGTVFKFNPTDQTVTVLHKLAFNGSDGFCPIAGLIEGSDGAFYGTAHTGDVYGTLFSITPSGVFTKLLTFSEGVGSASAGSYDPQGKLLEVAPGTLIGTALSGGPNNGGVVFRFSQAPTITGQSITVTTPAPGSAIFNASFGVAATASSGLAVAITTTGGCSGSGTGSATITMISGTTACVVHYNQGGDSNYSAAPEVTSSTTAQQAGQVITVTQGAPATAGYQTIFSVAATAPGGPVALAASGACAMIGSTVTMTSGTGTCTVTFDQAGNGDYVAAPQVTQTTTAQKASQTITVTQAAPATAPVNTSFPVAATASSGAAVKIAASGACSLKGKTVKTASTPGTCTVTFDQKGNGNYTAAPQVVQITTVQ